MADRTRRERLLTFLLLPAIVLAVLVLAGVMFRSSFQLEKLREQSVVEATLLLANERADRLDKRIIEQDNAVAALVDIADRADFGGAWVKVAGLQTPTVRAVLALDLSSPDRDVVGFASRAPGPDDERFRRLLIHTFLPELRVGEPPLEELRHLHRNHEAQSYLLSYWQRNLHGRQYLVVAWHDVPRIVHEIFPTLYSDQGQQSRVNVVDAQDRIVFGPPLSRGGFTLGKRFETTLYKWRLNVTMTAAEELAAAVEGRRIVESILVGLSGLVVVLGLVVILAAVARERKLSNLKSDFVANVSHELKTPLSLVRMFAELLESGRVENEEKRREYLRIIVSEGERLASLIDNVLDFARVERGQAAYQFTESAIGEVVTRAVEACRLRAERQDVSLELALEPGLPTTALDERAIEIAVINLIDNALKYAPLGRRIRVGVVSRGDAIEVRVSDEGHGIDPEDHKRIFERFVRGKGVASQRARGSGIGLALVRHIAVAHGGKAWVEPASPLGSTFIFTLKATKTRASVPGYYSTSPSSVRD